jgi:hypothetical protein
VRRSIITFIFFSTLFSKDYYEGDHLVKDGVYALYNYEFDSAVTILTNARDQYPDHPGVHLIWVAARWVRSQANDSFEEANILLETDLVLIQPVYEELVDRFDYDQTYQLYRGSALSLSARVTLGKKKWLKTFFRAYKGFSIIDNVAKKSPEIKDARLPIGIVEYYSAMSNILIKWAVELYGLDASREAGLNEISMAANEGDWAWIEAKGILSFLYLWVEDEPILAFKHSKDLVAHFPKNYYFNLLLLESMIRIGNSQNIKAIIEDIELLSPNLTHRQKEWYGSYFDYERALFFFHQKKYSDALEFLNSAINSYTAELDIILGNAYLLQGMTYDMMNDRNEAKSSYKKCLKLDNFSSTMNKAKQYLNQPYQGH